MSDRNDNTNAIVTALTVGAGLLAGIGYTAYQYFSNDGHKDKAPPSSNNIRHEANTIETGQHFRDVPQTVSDASQSIKKCCICSRVVKENEVFTLTCQHTFHKQCIGARFILESANPPFKCPGQTCKRIVSDAELHELIIYKNSSSS